MRPDAVMTCTVTCTFRMRIYELYYGTSMLKV